MRSLIVISVCAFGAASQASAQIVVTGGPGNEVLNGSSGADNISSGGGNDIVNTDPRGFVSDGARDNVTANDGRSIQST